MKHRPVFFIAALASLGASLAANAGENGYNDLLRAPDTVTVITETGTAAMTRDGDNFRSGSITFTTRKTEEGLAISVTAPGVALKGFTVRWNEKRPTEGWKFLGDAWERAYGDLGWKPVNPAAMLPWYFMASDGKLTHGVGVKVRPGAVCGWLVDAGGTTLALDTKNGGGGTSLGDRRLEACTIVEREGKADETPFAATRAFCKRMCTDPRLPKEPVYGFNDWYCDYGANSAQSVREYTDFIVRLSPKGGVRPFMVIDDGWQPGRACNGTGTAWNTNNQHFAPSMRAIADDIKARGARPGIWCRLLLPEPGNPASWRVAGGHGLDPSVPEVRARVRATVALIRSWGFELIKHDFSVIDLTGGINTASAPLNARWHFADRSRTTAEIVRGFYEDVRAGAGDDCLVMGCTTNGHLSAGIFDLSRSGDDTSGRDWNRVRQMGVNCLAFRAPQDGAFFATDADCVGLTNKEQIPWAMNRQWLDLLSRSGTPLFISFKKGALTPDQEKEVSEALARAAKPQPLAEPLDWMTNPRPTQWKLMGEEKTYDWGK